MGIVRVSAAMSLDGFIAGPDHEMDWVFEHGAGSDELVKELIDARRRRGRVDHLHLG
jgi:dihydrofolate reductase